MLFCTEAVAEMFSNSKGYTRTDHILSQMEAETPIKHSEPAVYI